MDLLNPWQPLTRTVGALSASAVLLCACSDGSTGGTGSDSPESSSADPGAAVLPSLTPVRPDEQAVGTESGSGPAQTSVAGRADDLVIVYGVCSDPGVTVTMTLTLPEPEPLAVPCDGVVTRAQVFTVPGQAFGLDVDAPAGTDWDLLVTVRSE